MTAMQLQRPEKYNMLALTEEEAARLVAAAKSGEVLYFENGTEKVTLENGVLTLEGFEILPILFAVYNEKKGTMNMDAEGLVPLKKLVKKAVVLGNVIGMGMSFYEFSNLTEVSLPDTVEYFYNTFKGCKKLKPYPFPKNLRVVSGTVFGIAPEELVLPEGMTDISSAFSGTGIRSVTLPKSLKELGTKAFSFCRNLARVTFSEGLTEIGDSAFSICDKLTSLTLPKSLEYIGEYAFSSCRALCDVSIPEGCRVEANAFSETPLEGRFQKERILTAKPIIYEEKMGEVKALDLLQSVLSGKSLEEQCGRFRVIFSSSMVSYSYGDEDGTDAFERGKPLLECRDVERLVIKDGIVVGVHADGCDILAGESVCTYFAIDEDGTGARERSDYCTLIFQP